MRPPRIDAHQHFWTIGNAWTDWPPPSLAAIHRDFGSDELRPHLARAQIDATVLVQAAPKTEDTADLLARAARTPFVAGVVGWVDFEDTLTAIAAIDRFVREGPLRGVRPMLQAIEQDDWILNPAFAPVFEALADRGLAFDALVQPRHLPALRALADRHPDVTLIIDHAAKPHIADRVVEPWATDLRALSTRPNVFCKLSGLLTEAAHDDELDALRPYADVVLDAFGEGRLLWGSDWPVVNLAGGYERWIELTDALLSDMSDERRADVMGGTAVRAYRLADIAS